MLRQDLELKLEQLSQSALSYRTDDITRLKAEILEAFDRPKVGVCVLVLDTTFEPMLLMEKRKHRHGHGHGEWSIPGGWVDNRESWEQAAKRELYEEVGLTFESGRFITATMTQFPAFTCVTGVVAVTGWHLHPDFAGRGDNEPFTREPDKQETLKWVPVKEVIHGHTKLFAPLEQMLPILRGLHYHLNFDEINGRKR